MYFTCQITGRVDKVNFLKSKIKMLPMPWGNKEVPHFIGLKLDLDSWDGTDFFVEREDSSCAIYVSEKVQLLINQHKITNIKLDHIDSENTLCEMIRIGATIVVKAEIDNRIKKLID